MSRILDTTCDKHRERQETAEAVRFDVRWKVAIGAAVCTGHDYAKPGKPEIDAMIP